MQDIILCLQAFTTVLSGMVVLTLFLYAVRYASGVTQRKEAAAALAAQGSTATSEVEVIDDELLAVLAAAAHAAIGHNVHIHHVIIPGRTAVEAWSRAGRMDIMFSHRVEPKR